MRMTKKITSIVLAVLMVVSMMVVGTVAASAATTVTSAAEFNAIADADGEYVLGADIDLGNGYLIIPEGRTVTIDFADYTYTSKWGIENHGTLTVKAGTGGATGTKNVFDNFGTLTVKSGTYAAPSGYGVYAEANSTTTIENGTFTAQECCVCTIAETHDATITIKNGTFTSADNSVLSGNGSTGAGNNTWTISGGTYNANIQSAGYVAAGIYAPNNDTWTISGGTFNVTNGVGICQRAGVVNVKGGTFNVTGDGTTGKVGDSRVVVPSGTAVVYDSKANYPAQSDDDKTTVTNVTVNAPTSVVQVKNDGDATRITVSGGTFDNEVASEFIDPIYEYDADSDKIIAKDDLTPVWEWVDSTSASYRYQAKLTLKDGDDVVYTKNYDPTTVTANTADGSFTYSCAAKKVANISYGPIADKLVEADGVIMTSWELYKAVNTGGSWKLGKNLNCTYYNAVADGFKLDGQGYKLTTTTINASYAMFQVKDKNSTFELSNVTLDGANKRYYAVSTWDKTSGGNNPNAEVTLNNVTIQNFASGNYTGAVYAFGSSTVNLNACTIVGNKVTAKTDDDADNTGAAIWAGAKATVNINGGTYDEILLHGGTSNATIDGGATVDTVRFGYTKITEDSTKMKAVINDATVNSVEKYTDFTPENVVMDPAQATVAAPEGYEWENSETAGMKTLVSANPLNPLEVAKASIIDGNAFGINVDYLKGTLLGVQKKTVAGQETSTQEGEKNMRFVAVIDTDLVQDPDVTDYGFVLAKVGTGKTTATTKFDNLKAGDDRAKTISAKGTYNNVCGTGDYSAYGDPTADTPYKYVTCAVNNVTDSDKIVARFFVKKDGKTYYAKYAAFNYNFTGCTAGWSDLG